MTEEQKNEGAKAPKSAAAEIASVIMDRVVVLALLGIGAWLIQSGDREHGSQMVVGALALMVPLRAPSSAALAGAARALPLAAAVAVGIGLSGCASGVTAGTVGRATCWGVAKLHDACEALGLDPGDPCPLLIDAPPSSGGEDGAELDAAPGGVRMGARARVRATVGPAAVVASAAICDGAPGP